jgi:hypothetical protein
MIAIIISFSLSFVPIWNRPSSSSTSYAARPTRPVRSIRWLRHTAIDVQKPVRTLFRRW